MLSCSWKLSEKGKHRNIWTRKDISEEQVTKVSEVRNEVKEKKIEQDGGRKEVFWKRRGDWKGVVYKRK